MEYSHEPTERVPVKLSNGEVIQVEVTSSGSENVGFGSTKNFSNISKMLEGLVEEISGTLHKVNPSKATVKFGMEIAVESGQLTAILIKGTGKSNLEITLEWSK
jgi:hypothetical protein